jgi:hypothetical protein
MTGLPRCATAGSGTRASDFPGRRSGGSLLRVNGVMNEEYLFWNNLTYMKQIGLAQ